MVKIMLFFISLFFVCCNSTSMQENVVMSYLGIWKVYKIEAGSISALTTLEADSIFSNKNIEIDSVSSRFFDEKCDRCSYSTKRVNSEDYLFDEFRVTAKKVGVEVDSLTVIEVNCANKDKKYMEYYPAELFLLNTDHLILVHEGMFLHLKRLSP